MATFSVPVSIHIAPRSPTEADIAQHRSIRLDALRIDPESFLSTYAYESKFKPTEWRERLEQDGAWTFYAKSDEVHENLGDAHRPSKPWIATLTLLSPSFLSTVPSTTSSPMLTSPFSLLVPGTDVWLIVGLWVRPEWRRNGVAQKIIEKAVRFVVSSHLDAATTLVAAPDAYQSPSGSFNSKTTVVLLEVFTRNRPAVEFYRSVGFQILNPEQFYETTLFLDEAEDGSMGGEYEMEELKTLWMGYTIPPLPFPHRSNL